MVREIVSYIVMLWQVMIVRLLTMIKYIYFSVCWYLFSGCVMMQKYIAYTKQIDIVIMSVMVSVVRMQLVGVIMCRRVKIMMLTMLEMTSNRQMMELMQLWYFMQLRLNCRKLFIFVVVIGEEIFVVIRFVVFIMSCNIFQLVYIILVFS